MDSFEGNGDYMDDGSADQLLSLESSNMSGYSGEPEIPPRIGNQYQVEIPPLQGNCTSYIKMLADQENIADISRDFMVGLAIPLVWVNQGVGSVKNEKLEDLVESINAVNDSVPSEPESTRLTNMHSEKDDIAVKMEQSDTFLDNKVTLGESANLSSEKELQETRVLGYCLVPGTVLDIWTGTEKASFVLGLYIFEKNFVHVKRFVETKGTGDILSFYYGEFYRSDEYRRWSECRKVRSRRSVCGQKMFTGSRQQELMSRLLPRISEENQKDLAEVSKAFGEGKISLEEYVFPLKAMIGVNMLIEAVGIGKGGCIKSDWTDETKVEQDDLPTRQRPCYLQPPNRYTDSMKFTVVDTSLSDGKPYKLRELRSLPVDISNKLSSGNHAEESEEESTDESESVGTSVLIEAETKHNNSSRIISNGEMQSDEGYKISFPSQKFQEASNEGILASSTVPVNDSKKTKNICEAKKPRKVVKANSFKRLKENSVDFVAPVAKRRRRLTACSRASVLVNSLMEKEMGHPSSSNDNIPIASSEDKVSSSNSSKSSPSQSAECASADRHVSKLPDKEPQTREMIDLNEPQVPADSEFEIVMPALMEDQSGNMKSPDDVCGEMKTSTHSGSVEQQQPSLNSRRHSTRNRPPTTRALEALANGFLTVNSRQKNKEGVSKKKSTSRSSRQTPGGMRVTDFSNSTVVSQMEEDKGAVSMGGDTNMFGKIQHPPEESGTIISGP